MSRSKSYKNSLLSLFCIISSTVIIFKILQSASSDGFVVSVITFCAITFLLGIVAGITLLILPHLKYRNLKHTFIYNLTATFNIVTGFWGMLYASAEQPTPYTITASLTVGIIMYKSIYSSSTTTSNN
jgi:hypothetical protein